MLIMLWVLFSAVSALPSYHLCPFLLSSGFFTCIFAKTLLLIEIIKMAYRNSKLLVSACRQFANLIN